MRVTLAVLFVLIALDYAIFNSVHARGDDNDFNFNSNRVSSNAAGGNATNEGISVAGSRYNSEDSFYSFSTTFPQAHGCFGGAQGGLGNDGSSGFFGMHFINENCWTAALAGAQANIEVKARLQCAGKVFRNAIAYDQKKNKQSFCVGFMLEKYRAEIALAEQQVESAVELGALTPMTEEIVIAANVTQEELEAVTDDQQQQIDELKRRTQQAEKRAREAEEQLQKLQAAEKVKRQKLMQLQQELRVEYDTTETQ